MLVSEETNLARSEFECLGGCRRTNKSENGVIGHDEGMAYYLHKRSPAVL